MKYGFITIDTDDVVELIESDKEDFTLDELYKYSDCDCIQIIRTGKHAKLITKGEKLMVIDDEGKLKYKPINKVATALYEPKYDCIVGKAVIGVNNPFREPDIYKMPLFEAKGVYDQICAFRDYLKR